jgi:hypothetical protein
MAQIKDNKFKSVTTPFIDEYYKSGMNNNFMRMDNPNNLTNNYSQLDKKSQNNMNSKSDHESNKDLNGASSIVAVNLTSNMGIRYFMLLIFVYFKNI